METLTALAVRHNGKTLSLPSKVKMLWWQEKGLSYTASGYGKKIPTIYMVHFNGRWRRVYCCVFSNIGTCFIGRSINDGQIVN